MKESDILEIIKDEIGKKYLGDDCAFLKDLGIVISQDNLVENIHFKMDWCTPYQLGYKSVAVNISDILASGAKPVYLTIALSLPSILDKNFAKEFYKGAKKALHGAKIVGGDITGSKCGIMISVSALGTTSGRNISSRAYAKEGYVVITKGKHGSSAAGLAELMSGSNNKALIKAHLEPRLEYEFSKEIAEKVKEPYAMMDSSDGLGDALFKIAESSGVKIKIDYQKIPKFKGISEENVMFGGEDYKLIAAVPKKYLSEISGAVQIGVVEKFDGIRLEFADKKYSSYDEINVYNHFGENNG